MKKYTYTLLTALVLGLMVLSTTSANAMKTSELFVDDDGADCPQATYTTIADAVTAASAGDTIRVCAGSYDGVALDKSVEIKGVGNAVVISGGPAHSSGLSQGFRMLAGSDGAVLSNLIFNNVDLAIMNGDAVNGVVVSHNTFNNAIQAVSNWRGDNWMIDHNTITDLRSACGGGIGILVGDYSGSEAVNNTVIHNKISGTLYVSDGDCGGYNGTGIVLYADYRGGRSGGEISGNVVEHNKVSLVSDTPDVVDVAGIELTDTRDDVSVRDIFDNVVRFNDLRGTVLSMVLTPTNLDEYNLIARNKVN